MITSIQGMPGWLLQRLTALFMLLYFIVASVYFLLLSPQTYSEWHSMFSATPVALLTVLFFVAVLLHAWIGLRDIVIDYVHRLSLRLLLLGLIAMVLLGQTVWLLLVVTKAIL